MKKILIMVFAVSITAFTGYDAEAQVSLADGKTLAWMQTSGRQHYERCTTTVRNAVHQAAFRNDKEAVKDHLAKGITVNALDSDYRTPLHWAVQSGHREMVKFLLENGADVNVADIDGKTPLFYTRIPAVIELLLEHGADPEVQNSLGNTLLHNSVFFPPVVDLLLKHGVDISLKNNKNQTVLDIASIAGRTDIVSKLVLHGADISGPLHAAVHGGMVETTKEFLAQGADVHTRDEDGNTLLHKALMTRTASVQMLNLLLEHSANINALNNKNQAPLHLAVRGWNPYPYLQISTILVEAGADVNAVDDYGMTPFLYAVTRGASSNPQHARRPQYPNLVRMLLENGANFREKYTSRHHIHRREQFPLHYAVSVRANDAITKILVEHGAEISAQDANGSTPLHIAASEPCTVGPGGWMRNQVLNAEVLIEHGAEVNARDNNGRTPLHIAANAGRLRAAALLLQKGADINAEDTNGKTPPAIAEERNHAELVEFFKKPVSR